SRTPSSGSYPVRSHRGNEDDRQLRLPVVSVPSSAPRREASGAGLNPKPSPTAGRQIPMLTRLRLSTLQAGLVLFWAIWLSLITLTNLADALRQLGALPDDFTFASYNFDLVKQTVGAHGAPGTVAAVLFAGVILWE